MKLYLPRGKSKNGATLSPLYVDGYTFGYVLEDVIREIPGKPVAEWKVYAQTAIPQGTYTVLITSSVRFKCPMPLVNNVPGFEGIRIHAGNSQADTAGCLLVGYDRHPTLDSAIARARVAFDALFSQIDAAIKRHEPVSITIENPKA